jgi:hypothetical protein
MWKKMQVKVPDYWHSYVKNLTYQDQWSCKKGPWKLTASATRSLEILTLEEDYKELHSAYKMLFEQLYKRPWNSKSQELADPSNSPLIQGSYDEMLGRQLLLSLGKRNLYRVALIQDYAGKTRNVAIGPNVLQSILRPLNQRLMKILRSIPEDYSYGRDPGPTLRKWTLDKENLYSFDLKSATDRFPVHLMKSLIKELLGDKLAEVWDFCINQREFDLPGSTNLQRVKYGTGGPMGIYSNWSTFSLCHHLLVRAAAADMKVSSKLNYLILGDDVVIKGSKIARRYQELVKLLGVEIDLIKSNLCTPDIDGKVVDSRCEFTKRLFINGIEVSPLPIRLLEKSHPVDEANLINEIGNRCKWLLRFPTLASPTCGTEFSNFLRTRPVPVCINTLNTSWKLLRSSGKGALSRWPLSSEWIISVIRRSIHLMQTGDFLKFWDFYFDSNRGNKFLNTLERHLSRGSGKRLTLLPSAVNDLRELDLLQESSLMRSYVLDANYQINHLMEVESRLEGLGDEPNLENDLEIIEEFWKNPPRLIMANSYATEEIRKYREVPSRLSKALMDIEGDNYVNFVNTNVSLYVQIFNEFGITD